MRELLKLGNYNMKFFNDGEKQKIKGEISKEDAEMAGKASNR
ncbi:MAG: hypothetical protein WC637_01760 [Victivallales bacterium]|jgi:hypothetical protein